MIKTYWEWFLLFLGLLYWAVVSIAISLVGTFLSLILPEKYALVCGRFLLQTDFLFFTFLLKISGLLILDSDDLKSLRDYKGGMIIAPNHTALWDIVFIVAQIPEAICVMKGVILNNPFLGGGARVSGYIPINSISQMLKLSIQRLKQGETLLMFPEGTRTKTNAQWLNPLRGGVAVLAKQTGVPVFPVFIRSNTRFYEKGWPLYKKPEFPLKIKINVGEPICFAEGETTQAFTQRLEAIYLEELAKPHPLRRTPDHSL
ncbi:MAG: 1-acyl-sn-glycerol-3-phosphate acyltransferase [Methyloprofundus sp.]|nr:1-acyl-sn-glycerol-3-phosphate acyltransferase [Methyloprofundus sp.]